MTPAQHSEIEYLLSRRCTVGYCTHVTGIGHNVIRRVFGQLNKGRRKESAQFINAIWKAHAGGKSPAEIAVEMDLVYDFVLWVLAFRSSAYSGLAKNRLPVCGTVEQRRMHWCGALPELTDEDREEIAVWHNHDIQARSPICYKYSGASVEELTTCGHHAR